MSEIQIFKVSKVKTPVRGTENSAGIDFFIPDDFIPLLLEAGGSINIPAGIRVRFEDGFAFVAMNKSGVALKKNLQVGACVIDSDYTGEIHLHVTNIGQDVQMIKAGDKLVQFLMLKIDLPEVVELDKWEDVETERGDGGFGSTGTK